MVSEIHSRRIVLPYTPFLTGLLVWTKTEDGRVYARSTTFQREYVRDQAQQYGIRAIRNFIRALREELATDLEVEANRVYSPEQRLDFQSIVFTFEKATRMLGLRYRYLHEQLVNLPSPEEEDEFRLGGVTTTYPGWIDAEAFPWAYSLKLTCDEVFCPCKQRPARLDPPGAEVAA